MAFAKVKPVPQEFVHNVVIYARYSSDKQTENSIDGQLRICHEYCKQKGFTVVGEYIDRAMSGTDDNRPDFQRMIKDAEKQRFAFIIVYRFDRFMRNRYDSAIYKKRLEQFGVRVLSTAEQVTDGDEGIILESIYEAMDEAYSRRLSKITKRGMREAAEKGLWTGGNIPIGFKVENQRVVLDEYNARGVRMMYELIYSGKTLTQAAEIINNNGYRTKSGKLWSASKISSVLRNPMNYGDYTYKDEEMGNIYRECPSIVTKDLFDKVIEILDRNKKTYGRKTNELVDFMLSGKLFCGPCGSAMVGDSGTSRSGAKHYYYTCGKKKKRLNGCKKKSEKKDFLEWYVCEQTIQYILTEDGIKEISRRVVEEAKKDIDTAKIDELTRALKRIEQDIDDSVEALIHAKSDMVREKIEQKLDTLEKQKSSASEELSELKYREDLIVTEDQVQQFLRSFLGGDLLSKEYQRMIINTLVNSVYIWDDKIVIYYNVKGGKQIGHLDTIDYLEELTESECSDSFVQGEPNLKLFEHSKMIYFNGGVGIVIGRD